MPSIRFSIEPRDVSPRAAATRMGVPEVKFHEDLPLLIARGFPKPDETTGNFDLNAIDEWCDRRHPGLFIVKSEGAVDARSVVSQRLEKMKNGTR